MESTPSGRINVRRDGPMLARSSPIMAFAYPRADAKWTLPAHPWTRTTLGLLTRTHRAPEMAPTHALFVPGTQLDHQFERECLSSSMLSWLAAATVPRPACLLGASCGLTPLADPRNHVVMGWI